MGSLKAAKNAIALFAVAYFFIGLGLGFSTGSNLTVMISNNVLSTAGFSLAMVSMVFLVIIIHKYRRQLYSDEKEVRQEENLEENIVRRFRSTSDD
jgi:membrane protein YdbS with pleckstrin-like domain